MERQLSLEHIAVLALGSSVKWNLEDELLRMAGGTLSELAVEDPQSGPGYRQQKALTRPDSQARIYPSVNEKLGRTWWDYGELHYYATTSRQIY